MATACIVVDPETEALAAIKQFCEERGKDDAPNAAYMALLIGLLEHEDAMFRREASRALGCAKEVNDELVQALALRLSDPDPLVREAACLTLGSYGEASSSAIDGIAELAQSGIYTDRLTAFTALEQMGSESIPALTVLSQSSESAVSDRAAGLLRKLAESVVTPPSGEART